MRRHEPHLVLDNRPGEYHVRVVHRTGSAIRDRSCVSERIAHVVGLQVVVGAAREQRAAEAIAALARNDIEHDAVARIFGGRAAGRRVDDDLLRGQRVHEERAPAALAFKPVERHAVEQHLGVALLRSVQRRTRAGLALAAADVLRVGRRLQPRRERVVTEQRLCARHRIEQRFRQHRLARHRLGVDQRRRARHRHRLFDRTDVKLRVHGRVEARRQLDAFAPEGREASERERDSVGAGFELDDAVLAALVGDRAADLLDEDRARRLDRHTGQHRAGGVGDQACNGRRAGALAQRRGWMEGDEGEDQETETRDAIHGNSFST